MTRIFSPIAPVFIFILLLWTACNTASSPPGNTGTEQEITLIDSSMDPIVALDTTPAVVTEPVKITGKLDRVEQWKATVEEPMDIYVLHLIEFNDMKRQFAFVNLSERYPASEHPDSLSVEDKYLGEEIVDRYNLHTLNESRRKNFLYRKNFSDKDKLFLYHFEYDKVTTFNVKDLPLTAYLTPYGANVPLEQWDYLIGFEVKDYLKEKFGKYQGTTLAYVGQTNPFQTGKIRLLIWEKISPEDIPADINDGENIDWLKDTSGITYRFEMNRYLYLLRHSPRHLIIVDTKTKNIIFSRRFYDSEGTSLAPLTIKGENNESDQLQWTGEIFKDKPIMVYGFQFFSFSCQPIFLAGYPPKYIPVLCDNRH